MLKQNVTRRVKEVLKLKELDPFSEDEDEVLYNQP